MTEEYYLFVIREDASWYVLSFETRAEAEEAAKELPEEDVFGKTVRYDIVKARYRRPS